MDDYGLTAWKRLGRDVKRARLRAGKRDMKAWAEEIGRSTRVLQGLERGEHVGDDTLMRVEQVLGWPDGRSYTILEGPVGPDPQDAEHVGARGSASDEDDRIAQLVRTARELADEVERLHAGRGAESVDGSE